MNIYLAGAILVVLVLAISYYSGRVIEKHSDEYDPWWHVDNSERPGGHQ